MLAVTDLTNYLYCKRQLYFRKVLGIREKPKPQTVHGSIRHKVFEICGREDQEIVLSITKDSSLEDVELKFRAVYYRCLKNVLKAYEKQIKKVGENSLKLFKEMWPDFLGEAKDKAKDIFDTAKEKEVYGEELWESLPKAEPEIKLSSEVLGIRGIIDRIDDGNVPVEIKTGRAPVEGIRKEHMVQVGAYMMMLSEKLDRDVNEGYVEYTQVKELRKVVMNPFLRDEILELIKKVRQLLTESSLPEKVKDDWKCKYCGIKEECFDRKA